jgi:hypothetical protein
MIAAATPPKALTPRDLGLEFEAEDGAVIIRTVDAGGEGEAVGLIVGDVVVGIDGLRGTVEEMIAELCDDSCEVRATMMRVRRGEVTMAAKLFAALPGAERCAASSEEAPDQVSVRSWMCSQPVPARADAADAVPPLQPPMRQPIADESSPFGRRDQPNCPPEDCRFFESIRQRREERPYDPFALPDGPPPSHWWNH